MKWKRQLLVGLKSVFEAYLMQWFFVSQSYTKVEGNILLVHVLLIPKSQHLGWSKLHVLAQKRVIFGNRRHKTARQLAEWASTEKPMASKDPHNMKNL